MNGNRPNNGRTKLEQRRQEEQQNEYYDWEDLTAVQWVQQRLEAVIKAKGE